MDNGVNKEHWVLGKGIPVDRWGREIWVHKTNKDLFGHCAFGWCDRIIIIDEENGRKVLSDNQYTTFDLSEYRPMTVEEFESVTNNFKEIHNVR